MIKTRQKRKNSNRKGTNFEREVARILSKWWNKKLYKKNQFVFWRTHGSGKAKHISKDQEGDITYIHPDGKPLIDLFIIECKRTKRFNLFGIIANDKSIPMLEWLTKLKSRSSKLGKYGLLIFKLDRYPEMCAIDTYISKKLSSITGLGKKKVLRLYKPFPFDFYLLDDFLSFVNKETIIKCNEILTANKKQYINNNKGINRNGQN